MQLGGLRTRWAAIGAAIAVSLGAGGLGIAQATIGSGERAVFVAINPCRLIDTRPAPDNRGPLASPIGARGTYTVTAWGATGDCNLTSQPTALVLNVTALNATAATFITLYPTGATPPTTSNLNPRPGQPPTPNSVTVDLNASGRFDVFNENGSVNVIVDVVGYYEDHNHDDRYALKPEVIESSGINVADPLVAQSVFAVSETITTTKTGHLLITKTLNATAACTSGGRFYFLTVDGVPVRSSAQYRGNGTEFTGVLVGTTKDPVAAGPHEIGAAGQCYVPANSTSGASTLVVGVASVVVLD